MSRTDWLVDCVIVAGAFGFGLLQLTLSINLVFPDEFTRRMLGIRSVSPSPFSILSVFLICAPLIMRRRLPWACFILSTGLWLTFEIILGLPSLSLIAPLIALFTLSYELSKVETVIASIMGLLCVFLASIFGASTSISSLLLTQNFALVLAVAIAGYALNTTRKYAEAERARADKEAELREKEAELAAEALRAQKSDAKRRFEEQRAHIARDVHDITAHSLSAVNIQASAALSTLDSDPESSRGALSNIKALSKDSLTEIRLLLDMLRSSDEMYHEDPYEREPLHTLSDLGIICAYLDSAGIPCSLHIESGIEEKLPVYKQVAVYDMAREAATNIVKHSKASKASISLSKTKSSALPKKLLLVVEDDGCGLSDDLLENGGHGILGMEERAAILGGKLELGDSSLGGLRLEISIPL